MVALGEDRRADLAQRNDALAEQALRVLAIATRSCDNDRSRSHPLIAADTRSSSIEPPESGRGLVCAAWPRRHDPSSASGGEGSRATAKGAHTSSATIDCVTTRDRQAIARSWKSPTGRAWVTGCDMRDTGD